MKKILYLSCHSVLEFDEISMFHELGYEVFSPGAYFDPQNKSKEDLRPAIPTLKYSPDIVEQYHKLGAAHPGEDAKGYLTKEFVDNFDVVIVMHVPEWIHRNWEVIKHKRVIWRTIGQSVASTELNMQPYVRDGLQVVRYSPREVNIPHFCGQHGIIRFAKDPEVYNDWNGFDDFVINFSQNMQNRGNACSYDFFEAVTRPFKRKLFGPGNNQPRFGMGRVSYEQQLEELKNNRVYFYTGTHPASYTLNFIEAFMTGIPLVCIGPQHGNAEVWRNHDLYEIQDLIQNGVTGYVSDDSRELKVWIKDLLRDYSLAERISKAARKEAIKHFGKPMIREAWRAFLER